MLSPANLARPSGLSVGDVLRDLFSFPMRKATAFERTHCGLSPSEMLRDPHLWEVVLITTAFAITPVVAATFAPLLMLPLELMEVNAAAVGLGVLATAAGITVGGTALANAAGGENWYQGLGWQLIGTAGLLSEWASEAEAETSASGYSDAWTKVRNATEQYRQEWLARGSRKKPTAVAAAIDRETGAVYLGYSSEVEDIVPELLERFAAARARARLPWSVGNCAEVHAVNKALKAGVRPYNIEYYTLRTSTGLYFPSCKYCEVILSHLR